MHECKPLLGGRMGRYTYYLPLLRTLEEAAAAVEPRLPKSAWGDGPSPEVGRCRLTL